MNETFKITGKVVKIKQGREVFLAVDSDVEDCWRIRFKRRGKGGERSFFYNWVLMNDLELRALCYLYMSYKTKKKVKKVKKKIVVSEGRLKK